MNTTEEILGKFRPASQFLLKVLKETPAVAFVAGSGIGEALADCGEILQRIPYNEIPHFKTSGALGHKNEILLLKTGFKNVLVFSGRFHLYEGFSLDEVVANIAVSHLLKIKNIILTNAAGGLQPGFKTGDIMLIDDLVNFTFRNFKRNSAEDFKNSGGYFLKSWRENIARNLTEKKIGFREGTYLSVTGPNYETPAEIGAFRKIGAQAVGMSTIHEAQFAAILGMNIAGCSLITNTLHETASSKVTHDEVLEAAMNGRKSIAGFFKSAVETSGKFSF
ncbi:MAG: purine-nucleoside phosphorylase [Bacteroidota bacterium]